MSHVAITAGSRSPPTVSRSRPPGARSTTTPLTGGTLHSVATATWRTRGCLRGALAARVQCVGVTGMVVDPLMDKSGRTSVTGQEENVVRCARATGGPSSCRTSGCAGPTPYPTGRGGLIDRTTSHIQAMHWFKLRNGPRLATPF